MCESIESELDALKKPLLFASKDNFSNLLKIKNLPSLVNDLYIKALAKDLPENVINVLNKINKSFSDFEELSTKEKKDIINKALEILSNIKSDIASSVLLESGSNLPKLNNKSQYNNPLKQPIRYIKGVGPYISKLFAKRDVYSIEDLLFYFPRTYEDRRKIKKMSSIKPGDKETVLGQVVLCGKVQTRSSSVFRVMISDESSSISLIWFKFNEKFLRNTYKKGISLIVNGEITFNSYDNSLQIIHPKPENIEIIENEKDISEESIHFNRIVPIYPLTEGLKQRRIRKILKNTVDSYSSLFPESIPNEIIKKNGLLSLNESIKEVHFPNSSQDLVDLSSVYSVYDSKPHKTVAFYEFFLLELGLGIKKRDITKREGIPFKSDGNLVNKLTEKLPFELTDEQTYVIKEIESDMRSSSPMNRLLQGDVGSGKTVVSLIAMLNAIESGYQAVLMAPTEILAEQHLKSISNFLNDLDFGGVVLLKSALSKNERKMAYMNIETGSAQIIIGTHALIEEKVKFKNLGLVIIDEQHRFGVMQRAKLMGKGVNPDVLVMTATPIPRTLAITVYGDLDVSVIDKLPPGRKEVVTLSFKDNENSRKKIYEVVEQELKKGRQGYFIYPFIDESENLEFKHVRYVTKMYEVLQEEAFQNYRVGLLHGKMSSDEKDNIMNKFKANDLDILVSTTVVEVGVDVPNATFMVVENAERYGLSQLHQLRGRIGRGEFKSFCILVSSYASSGEAERKLNIMCNTTDGFRIAELDLEIRGPGEFLGTKQSGIPQFKFANLIRDSRILSEARDQAFTLIEKDPTLSKNPKLREQVDSKWGEMLDIHTIS